MPNLSKLIFIILSFVSGLSNASEDTLKEGAYLVRAAGCTDCHTTSQDERFAGGVSLDTPFGTFHTPNITPSQTTGIGTWKFEDFRRALREGVAPDGQIYYPAFPYRSYTRITDQDLMKMWDYLRSLPAVEKQNENHAISFPFNQRWLLNFWQIMFFRGRSGDPAQDILEAQGEFVPDRSKSASWNRGAYLVEGLFHCTECHTPRDAFGGLKTSQWMGGSNLPLSGRFAPNITPDLESGLGHWSKEDWNRFLASGLNKQGKSPAAEMADVIQNTSALTAADREAVIEYLMSLPPVRRRYNEP